MYRLQPLQLHVSIAAIATARIGIEVLIQSPLPAPRIYYCSSVDASCKLVVCCVLQSTRLLSMQIFAIKTPSLFHWPIYVMNCVLLLSIVWCWDSGSAPGQVPSIHTCTGQDHCNDHSMSCQSRAKVSTFYFARSLLSTNRTPIRPASEGKGGPGIHFFGPPYRFFCAVVVCMYVG